MNALGLSAGLLTYGSGKGDGFGVVYEMETRGRYMVREVCCRYGRYI